MDQASASPAASCARNPAAPKTSSSCSQSVDRSRTDAPLPARSDPQSEPHAAPSNRDPRPSSPRPLPIRGKGLSANLLFVSGTIPGPEWQLLGKVGKDLTVEQGYQAARQVALNQLTTIRAALGSLDRVK